MTKHEFITQLRDRLSELPEREVEERLSFYVEMIDDRIEDGRTEQEAVEQKSKEQSFFHGLPSGRENVEAVLKAGAGRLSRLGA